MDLFDHQRQQLIESEAPLAARLRPHTLDEFVGQSAIVGPGRLLRRAIQADQLSSLIFYGPPGTGKTTLARIIANTTLAHFISINAVLAGVKAIREAVDTAQHLRGQRSQRTILFVDEVHRFNKAQQDALLPWVENGTLILIGATTENPYFEVNKALVSRSRIFQLKPLAPDDLRQVVHRALADQEQGYGKKTIELEPEALVHLINIANGDARALLNALELAVETTEPDVTGTIAITLAIAEASIQRRAILYDKEGDAHFDTISAFIKSMRGSDPDAAIYWLARMVYAGEDPRFIFRRMVIFASEDVGLADPQAVGVVMACAQAFDRVGLPEGQYPLAQAALYLAAAPKSNSVLGYFDALSAVEKEREMEVPNPLKDGSRDSKQFGHGANYKYPHAYRDHWVAQQYLPNNLQGQVFYQPSDQGWEAEIAAQVSRRREAQLDSGESMADVVSYSPVNHAQDRWLQRTIGQAGNHAGEIRDRIFSLTKLQRHHVVLDLQARTGLLTWEALRQVPEGSVYACVADLQAAQDLKTQATKLPELQRPIVVQTALLDLQKTLQDQPFDAIVGRNVLMGHEQQSEIAAQLVSLLQPTGRIILAENVPSQSQRLYDLVDLPNEPGLYDRWVAAEECLYDVGDLAANPGGVEQLFEELGLQVEVILEESSFDLYVTAQLLERWFSSTSERLSYRDRLLVHLSEGEVGEVRSQMTQQLLNQTITWKTQIAYISAFHSA
ncbi:Replication-associated recombination protein A [Acaryochloris thomasi RCC1774]|uniref:Replication-associated recombination protein A n=1 Tax=Acaryochloris thomasi RCC1774 TaxID=1764569 RepID=A0A2W1JG15_9CYAN|nr:AAA family ATPase [Acaryochloris thomasi]PZD72366.1 Replication-associated recombination protein A [Acaryochloris thomasi RCC1774]